ncbi:MAG: hypothetical protein HKO76_05855 [Acidimicrobiia bacterium]|nr:hypothetical protein [Acidimicrobiia bacterium]
MARTDLTDLTRTSGWNQVLAAAAREDDEQWFMLQRLQDFTDLDKVSGTDLDERAKEVNPALISRKPQSAATGQVRFSVSTAVVGSDVTIAIGTEVQVPGSGSVRPIKFTTTAEGTILVGNTDSNLVAVVAQEAGTNGNVDPGTITGFGSKPSGVDSVTNPNAFTTGQDKEKDEAFRSRIKRFILSLSRATVVALLYAAFLGEDTASGKTVQFANVVEDLVNLGKVTVYIDDGLGTAEGSPVPVTGEAVLASAVGGETTVSLLNKPIRTASGFTIYRNAAPLTFGTDYAINPANSKVRFLPAVFPDGLTAADAITADYTYFDGLIQNTQLHVDGDATNRAVYPGYRAAGVQVRVLSPAVVQLSFSGNVTVAQGYSQTDVAAQVSVALQDYVNNLGIGEDVVLAELIERAMAVTGMYNLSIDDPSEDRVIGEAQLARLQSSNITLT